VIDGSDDPGLLIFAKAMFRYEPASRRRSPMRKSCMG